MHKDKLEAVAKRSAKNLQILIGELADEINDAIQAATEVAHDEGKDSIKITLSHSIVLDLGDDEQEDSLAVSVRHKAKLKSTMPDPHQPELPLDGDEDES
jgi:hypothetical protein